MPKRMDLKSILILGAGPIVIGQGCEFDYSGVQACRALKQAGYRVILVNSNPATIMTDPSQADEIYIEPIKWPYIEKIIEKERPCALLPTMGGQTALNCALDLCSNGILERYQVELIGASQDAIDKAEDRERFRDAMKNIGLNMPKSAVAHSLEEALQLQPQVGFPTIIRPSFTLGGSGGGVAYNIEEFKEICTRGLAISPTQELLIEESLLGWKEFEMEVVRDKQDNCIIICCIENLDPMGIHTGDSITVAPAQTLTDKEYQQLRNASIAVLREIGVETGGSNVQFAIHPETGRQVVIEMNPRVSRSSALASKATGFPIAKIAALLAVGYTLGELSNDMTGGRTPASFEPSLDYVVTKIPRFDFNKFPHANTKLTTQMKSIGEVMAIGRTFQASLQKALTSLELGWLGLDSICHLQNGLDHLDNLRYELQNAGPFRLLFIADAFRKGWTLEIIYQLTKIDRWFLDKIRQLVFDEQILQQKTLSSLTKEQWYYYKRQGFSDQKLANCLSSTEAQIRSARLQHEVRAVFNRVDSCSAEFPVETAYLYSSYEKISEVNATNKPKIMVLGSGPNRIGQGIEFDYCCVHAILALKALGYETIMVNCNPETVSTDYDIADRLYFEPLTEESVLNIVEAEKPLGIIVQFGGQTPLKLAQSLKHKGVPILGTNPDSIDLAEDRVRFSQLIEQLRLKQPANASAKTVSEGLLAAKQLGFPLMVRPSYVLGGRAMEIVYNEMELSHYLQSAVEVSQDKPILLDRFLDDAVEVDVDAIVDTDGEVLIAGIMEHIEQAGVHSGDSTCCLPPYHLSQAMQNQIKEQIILLASALKVVGLMNAQFAIQNNRLYILEVNPRASRTVPFVSKATGFAIAKIAAKCMTGVTLKAQGINAIPTPSYFSIKHPVFPFSKFPETDPILGPEMKSTGEVMGVADNFYEAYCKGLWSVGFEFNAVGNVFLSVKDEDKPRAITLAEDLIHRGYRILATRGTAAALQQAGLTCEVVNKVADGQPHIVDYIKNGILQLIINTTRGRQAIADSLTIRSSAVQRKVSYTTTMEAAQAIVQAMDYWHNKEVRALNCLYKTRKAALNEELTVME